MPAPEKRIPGQSNAEYERRHDPNAGFIGAQSLAHGGDSSAGIRFFNAVFAWFDRRKSRKKS